jgi:anti-anti-sigma regulatory factor
MTIELREDIGIRNIKNFYSQLKDRMKDESGITLDFSKVRRIDLSVIQVIMAARKKLRGMNKEIFFKSVSDEISKQLSLCGITD